MNSKRLLRVLGLVALLMGLLWIGQGTGYFPYPKNSFMISQMPWTYRGAALLVVGIVVSIVARRRG